MKRALLGALILTIATSASVAFAYTSPGSPRGFVNDFAQVLSPSVITTLEQELNDFERTTSNEIVVVTVRDMSGDYVEHYAVKLFEEWGIGKKDVDNGALLLVALEERKLRIEVGYGLEGALPDSVAQSIVDHEITPHLQQGDYDGAVTAGVRAIEQATKGEYSAPADDTDGDLLQGVFILVIFFLQFVAAVLARSKSWWAGGIVGAIVGGGIWWFLVLSTLAGGAVLVGLTLVGLGLDYAVSKGYENAKAQGVTPPWWTGGSGRSSGGGFGGFGGGSSGGGGASGNW